MGKKVMRRAKEADWHPGKASSPPEEDDGKQSNSWQEQTNKNVVLGDETGKDGYNSLCFHKFGN